MKTDKVIVVSRPGRRKHGIKYNTIAEVVAGTDRFTGTKDDHSWQSPDYGWAPLPHFLGDKDAQSIEEGSKFEFAPVGYEVVPIRDKQGRVVAYI